MKTSHSLFFPGMSSEDTLRATIPVFINSFNQPTYLKHILNHMHINGFKNIFVIDQNSQYAELIEYFCENDFTSRARLIRLNKNIGPKRTVSIIKNFIKCPFIFSDPDLDLPHPLNADFMSFLFLISEKYKCKKVGLALDISDPLSMKSIKMRHNYIKDVGIVEWESRFWKNELEKDVYRADIDTTFFLWNPNIVLDKRRHYRMYFNNIRPRFLQRLLPTPTMVDIRIAKDGFVAKHLPWYVDDKLSTSERTFYTNASSEWSTWMNNLSS